jgi:hypothetical protein
MRFKRCLVTGRRNWDGASQIKAWLRAVGAEVVIHGCAAGADEQAGYAAVWLRLKVEEHPADWDRHGKAAGPKRNAEMLESSKPDGVLAFYDGAGAGTRDMMARAVRARVPLLVIGPNVYPEDTQ